MPPQVLRPPVASTPSSNATLSQAHPSTTTGDLQPGESISLASRRPKRAAAIASQAATQAVSSTSRRKSSASSIKSSGGDSSSSSSTTLPRTPAAHTVLHSTSLSQQSSKIADYDPLSTSTAYNTLSNSSTTTRPMAALPRAKRARRGDGPMDNGYVHHSNGSLASAMAYDGAISPAGPSTHAAMPVMAPANRSSIVMGIDAALNNHHHHPQHLPLHPSRSHASVREVIGGREREVFVVDSNSPPAAPYSHEYVEAFNGHHVKGKRKAADTPSSAVSSAVDHTAGMTQTTAAKRRRKDVGIPAPMYGDQSLYNKPDAIRPVYANHVIDPSMANYAALAPKPAPVAPLPSYRGGYQAGITYQKQKNGVDPYAVKDLYSASTTPVPPELPVDDAEGHYIVREGQYVTRRYRIMSLLGQGTFGKVVKCKDYDQPRLVAIKIIRAVQKYTDAAQIEIRVLQTLREADPWNENKCIHLLDTFTYLNHVCIVSELLGQSVFDFLKDNDFHPFPPRHIWSFAKQLLRSVAFLHGLKLVHTDLKPENILLVNGAFDLVPRSWRANAKKTRVLQDTDIRLIDFGSATFDDEYHSQVVSTRHYRAPEIILQMGWSFPCDAWSIGCILIEFYTGDALFQTHDNLEHLAMMEAVLGKMPDDFCRKAQTYRPNLFRGGQIDYPNSSANRQSRKYVKAMKPLGDMINSPAAYRKHDQRFKHLLERLLTFDPTRRISVEQALRHPYFELTENEIPA